MDQRVRLWDLVMLASASRPMLPDVLSAGSLLRPPALPEAIDALEERLGRTLPDSYKSFLRFTDGAHDVHIGPEAAGGPYALLPAGEVCRLGDVDLMYVDLWAELFEDSVPEPRAKRADGSPVEHYAPIREAVSVSSRIDCISDCLVPVDPAFDAAGEGWEVWETYKEGSTRFASFTSWLDWHVEVAWVLGRRSYVSGAVRVQLLERWLREGTLRQFGSPADLVRSMATVPEQVAVELIDRTWRAGEPFTRLAAAQADLAHRPELGVERLHVLAEYVDDDSVRLSAGSTILALEHSGLPRAAGQQSSTGRPEHP
ncbi:MAG TPA: SMI1/KNR4 family protein [Nocardioidaceae bacterium]|nr:SMI1/KNR4 family protein [Nocardioidaceae bacterium]